MQFFSYAFKFARFSIVPALSLWSATVFSQSTCASLFSSATARASASSAVPDVVVIGSGDGFIIYKNNSGETRILFNTRKAEVVSVEPSLVNTSGAFAAFNSVSGRIRVMDGRHRAVAASQGYTVRPELGGTRWRYWLDYAYFGKVSLERTVDDGREHKTLRLTDVKITWDVSVFN